jgi:hypothetical protein
MAHRYMPPPASCQPVMGLPPGVEPLYAHGQAEPVAVTATSIIRNPAQLGALRRASCFHAHREPVNLLTGEHIADICLDCDADLEVR